MSDDLYKATEKWEAWSNREYVIFQHLEPLYKSQRALSKILMHKAAKHHKVKEMPAWTEFFEAFGECIQKAQVKSSKVKSNDIQGKINKIYTDFMGEGRCKIPISRYSEALYAIGCMYDILGYSSPERKVIKSPFVSDLDTGIREEEEMEAIE